MSNTMHNRHDLSFKKLFNYKPMMESLLRDFVPLNDFIDSLDFATLRRCSGDQVADGFSERGYDMIWEVRQRDGTTCYVCLLFESRSTADRVMALRVMTCSGLFLLEMAQKYPTRPFPPMLPIVLYNGLNELKPIQDKTELYGHLPESLMSCLPQQSYLLLDVKHISLTELNNSNGLVALIIKSEQTYDLEDFQTIVDEWIQLTCAQEYKDMQMNITE